MQSGVFRKLARYGLSDPAVYPIVGIVGAAVGFTAFVSARNLAQMPDVNLDINRRTQGSWSNYSRTEELGRNYYNHAWRASRMNYLESNIVPLVNPSASSAPSSSSPSTA
jgi:hypothetical protein